MESLTEASGNDWRPVVPSSKLNHLGETEAGYAGKQPCRGITWWACRADEVGKVGLTVSRFLLQT